MDVSDDDEAPSVFQRHSGKVRDFLKKPTATNFVHQHQIDAVVAATDSFNSGNGISLVVLPTGCGKTGVAVLAAYAIGAKRVLVVTPSVTITEQIGDAFCHQERSFFSKEVFYLGKKLIAICHSLSSSEMPSRSVQAISTS